MSKNMKPARKQVEAINVGPQKNTTSRDRGSYNIWYGKYSNDPKHIPLQKASTRVNIEKDSGATKASTTASSTFCFHFARGQCAKGYECSFLHRIPTADDELNLGIPLTMDIFGREKHRFDREDMGGVGTFSRENKTLYIGNIKNTQDMKEIVLRHFEEFGEIEKYNVLNNRCIAFVTYKSRLNAEFAREAMMGQSLDNDECLNVRWASEDPNPKVVAETKRKYENIILEKTLNRLPVVGNDGTIANYDDEFWEKSEKKKAKIMNGNQVHPTNNTDITTNTVTTSGNSQSFPVQSHRSIFTEEMKQNIMRMNQERILHTTLVNKRSAEQSALNEPALVSYSSSDEE